MHQVWRLLQRMSEVELGLPLHYFDDFYPEEWGSGSLRCYPTFPSEEELERGLASLNLLHVGDGSQRFV